MYNISLLHHGSYPGVLANLNAHQSQIPVHTQKKEFYKNLKASSEEIVLIHASCPFNGPHAFLSIQQLFFLFLSEQIHVFHLQNPEDVEIDRLYQKLKRRFAKFNSTPDLRNKKISKVLLNLEKILNNSSEFCSDSHKIFSLYCNILMREHMDQLKLVAFFHPRFFVTDWSSKYFSLADQRATLSIPQTILDATFKLMLTRLIEDIEEIFELIPPSVSDFFDKGLTTIRLSVSHSFCTPEEVDEMKADLYLIFLMNELKKILESKLYGPKGSDIPIEELNKFLIPIATAQKVLTFPNLSDQSESPFGELKRTIGHLFNEHFQENIHLLEDLVLALLHPTSSSQEDVDLLSSKEFQTFLEKHTKISKSARRKEKRRAKALEGKEKEVEKEPTSLIRQPHHWLEETFLHISRTDTHIDRYALRNAAWHVRSILQLRKILEQASSFRKARFFTLFAATLYHSNYAIEQTLSAHLNKNRATHNLQSLSKSLFSKRRDPIISKLFMASYWVPRFVEEKAIYDRKMTFFSRRKVPGVLNKLNVLSLGQISEEQLHKWRQKAGKILEQTQVYLEVFMQASSAEEPSSESSLPLLYNAYAEASPFIEPVQNLRSALRKIALSRPSMCKMMQIDAYLLWAEEALKGCGEAIYLNDYAFWAHKIILSLHDTLAELLLVIVSQKSVIHSRKHEIPLLAQKSGIKLETEDVESFRGLHNKLRYPASETTKGSSATLIDLLEDLIREEHKEEAWKSKTQEEIQLKLDHYIKVFFRLTLPLLEHFEIQGCPEPHVAKNDPPLHE